MQAFRLRPYSAVWPLRGPKIRSAVQKSFVTARNEYSDDYFSAVIEAGQVEWYNTAPLDRFKNGRPRMEALTHKQKNTIYGRARGLFRVD